MKLRARLLSFTAAALLTTGAAFAAIDGDALADAYLADGYTYVEVKVGPTQTKVEAIKDGIKVEVIYDNETQDVIKREQEAVDGAEADRTGKEVRKVNRDFENGKDGDHKGGKDDDAEDDDHGKDNGGDDHDDDGGDDHGDDHGGDDHGGDDHGGGDHGGGDKD